eukprot:COSAG06_NODE_1828_length_8275_cov_2.284002_7_plen_105_part_00
MPSSEPEFPLPYRNDFESEAISQQPRFFSQMIGAFEVGIRPSFVSSESFLSSKFRTKHSRVVKTGLGHRRRRLESEGNFSAGGDGYQERLQQGAPTGGAAAAGL